MISLYIKLWINLTLGDYMVAEIIRQAQEILYIDQPQNQKEGAGIGSLNGYKTAAIICLGTVSVLSATAAIVTTIFASYLLASLFIAACIACSLSAVLTNRINVSPTILKLLVDLSEKVKEMFNKIQELENQQAQNLNVNDNDELVFLQQKEIENLKCELNKFANQKKEEPKVDAFMQELSKLKKDFKQKEEELSELRKIKEVIIDNDAQRMINVLRKDLFDKNKKIDYQKLELEKMQGVLKEKQRELAKLVELRELVNLGGKKLIADYQQEFENMQNENNALKIQVQQIPDQNRQIAELNAKIQEKEQEIELLKNQIVPEQKEDIIENPFELKKQVEDLNLKLEKALAREEVLQSELNLNKLLYDKSGKQSEKNAELDLLMEELANKT